MVKNIMPIKASVAFIRPVACQSWAKPLLFRSTIGVPACWSALIGWPLDVSTFFRADIKRKQRRVYGWSCQIDSHQAVTQYSGPVKRSHHLLAVYFGHGWLYFFGRRQRGRMEISNWWLIGSKISPFSLGSEKLWFENRGNMSWCLLCHTIMILL